jgi:hypothetical protein
MSYEPAARPVMPPARVVPLATRGQGASQMGSGRPPGPLWHVPGRPSLCGPAKWELPARKTEALIPSPCGPSRVQAGGRPGGFIFLERIAEGTIPSDYSPGRVRAGGCTLTASLSMAENGELESQRLRAHPPSKRSRHPDRFILQERRAENSNPTRNGAHSLAARPGTLTRSLSIEARAGFEPAWTALQAAT